MGKASLCLAAAMAWGLLGAAAAGEKVFVIQEPFGLAWGHDRVTYSVDFPQGEAIAHGLRLSDAAGTPAPVQVCEAEYWPDQTLKKAKIAFVISLQPGEKATRILRWQREKVAQPQGDLAIKETVDFIEMSTSQTGIRLPAGKKTFGEPAAAEALPSPIQAVRLPNGKWVGKGYWQTDVKCRGYGVEVLAAGPVFGRARLRYDFADGKCYRADVELTAGQDLAVVSEEFDLSAGKRYRMSGLNGMKPDMEYAYVLPKFEPPEKALIWDWWGQSMAVLPTPNAYYFSLAGSFQPDSAEWHGNSKYGNLRSGDGGLAYDQDGRFAYLNAYMQWGDEEGLCLGLYNKDDPATMFAVAALRPSQWLHPDIDPHPDRIIQQYTQTNCLIFERRKSGEVFFRAPACLGKRVYGIGGMRRTLAKHIIPERSGPKISETDIWGSPLLMRHVRLGRLELDMVKDWKLVYDEPAKYPRLYVPEGDRVRYESRRLRKPLAEVEKMLQAAAAPSEAEVKAVADAIARTRHMVHHFAQIDKGHMDFGIEEGLLADLCEDALSSPACSPEDGREIRKWLAAIVYFAMHPDFVPPRTAGFAWGSANMMAQVQCRAARIAALLPNHPQGKEWRQYLARVITLYIEDQVNEAGCTLECPHYGGMAITMPAMALAALQSCNGQDLRRPAERLRAAALMRLGTLLPPDVRGGFRSQCPEGDGYYDAEATFATLAGFFQKSDPELAAYLVWGVRESNNALGGHSDPSYKLFDVGLELREPHLVSCHYPGYGFVMRNGFPRADEAYVQVYAGSFSWGHGHCDRGTWVMYAKGAPLMMDFAAMYTPSMREQWLHPGGLTFNHDEKPRPVSEQGQDDWSWHFYPGRTSRGDNCRRKSDYKRSWPAGQTGFRDARRVAGQRADYQGRRKMA